MSDKDLVELINVKLDLWQRFIKEHPLTLYQLRDVHGLTMAQAYQIAMSLYEEEKQ